MSAEKIVVPPRGGFQVKILPVVRSKIRQGDLLEPFEERNRKGIKTEDALNDLRGRLSSIEEAFIAVFPPPTVRGW